jgi:hypothetical protein
MIEIRIFILPTELVALQNLLHRLHRASSKLSDVFKHRLVVVMATSDDIVDWRGSIMTKEECIGALRASELAADWTPAKFIASEAINGCVSMRREKFFDTDPDWYLWLDSDIIFNDDALVTTFRSIDLIQTHGGIDKFVLTPSTVRLWDETWDCIVSPHFIDMPLGYYKTNNPYEDVVSIEVDDYQLSEVRNTSVGQPYMKFAGGWFTVISHALLQEIPIPQTFTHYGMEDTYIMLAAHLMNRDDIKQFRNEDLIVCENYFDRDISISDKVKLIDRREEYKIHNQEMARIELSKFMK